MVHPTTKVETSVSKVVVLLRIITALLLKRSHAHHASTDTLFTSEWPCYLWSFISVHLKLQSSDAGDFNGRKLDYFIRATIVSDVNLIIRCNHNSWPRSTYDDRVMKNSDLCKNSDLFFSVCEFIIGNSACEDIGVMIAANKNLHLSSMSKDNIFLTHVCLQIEFY